MFAVCGRAAELQNQESFEDYLGIFDEFYADDIVVGSENGEEPIRGKARVRSLIATFLVPLHILRPVRKITHGEFPRTAAGPVLSAILNQPLLAKRRANLFILTSHGSFIRLVFP